MRRFNEKPHQVAAISDDDKIGEVKFGFNSMKEEVMNMIQKYIAIGELFASEQRHHLNHIYQEYSLKFNTTRKRTAEYAEYVFVSNAGIFEYQFFDVMFRNSAREGRR